MKMMRRKIHAFLVAMVATVSPYTRTETSLLRLDNEAALAAIMAVHAFSSAMLVLTDTSLRVMLRLTAATMMSTRRKVSAHKNTPLRPPHHLAPAIAQLSQCCVIAPAVFASRAPTHDALLCHFGMFLPRQPSHHRADAMLSLRMGVHLARSTIAHLLGRIVSPFLRRHRKVGAISMEEVNDGMSMKVVDVVGFTARRGVMRSWEGRYTGLRIGL